MQKKFLGSVVLTLSVFCITANAATLRFTEACSTGDDIEILAVGDILLHSPLQIQAAKNQNRFKSLWTAMIPYIEKADIAYANLEGPVAENQTSTGTVLPGVGLKFDNKAYTSYPLFNYHPALVSDIKDSGFDIVSTANNHAMDRKSSGADKTIEELIKNNVLFTGTRKASDSSNPDFQWYTITQARGHSIAWLACSFSTNENPDPHSQVLPCFQNQDYLLGLVSRLAKDPAISAVIVTPHWGVEYQLKQNAQQQGLGRKLIEAGATAVLATHPHVVQPWEKITTADGREGLIVYSTGNFVSNQPQLESRTSVMVQLHLTDGSGDGKLKIRGASYLPIYMQRQPLLTVQPAYDMAQVPSVAKNIWLGGYGEENRITSLQEDQVQKLCENSKR